MATTIAVCVCTHRRPELLRSCVESLARQTARDDPELDVRLVVVDNDAEGSAEPVRAVAADAFGAASRWVVEPTPGIPHARNRAVAEAGAADLLAFIDDDEVADPAWLATLVATQTAHDADLVGGPVVPVERPGAPAWWIALRLDARPTRPDGSQITVAATNNVLVSRRALERYAGPFNTRLAAVGSSDTELFLRMGVDGACMVWSAHAVVTEYRPPTRMTLAWVTRRRLRGHSTWAVLEREVLGRPWIVPMIRSAGRVVEGAGRVLHGLVTGRRDRVYRGVLASAGGLGGMIGAAGFVFEEYGAASGRRARPVRARVGRTSSGLGERSPLEA